MSESQAKNQPKKNKNVKSKRVNKNKKRNANRKKGKVKEVMVKAENPIIAPVKDLRAAQGILNTFPVMVAADPVSFYSIPCAIVSFALVRDCTNPFAIYSLIYQDTANIAQSGTGVAPLRLKYMSDIFGALAPKSIPFRNGSISYQLSGINPVPQDSISFDGGLNYYMYVPGGPSLGVWATQVPPPVYTATQIADYYTLAINALAKKTPHLQVLRNVELTNMFIRDGSAFVQVSPYFGQGAGVGSPYQSVELEVPFLSHLLGTLQAYNVVNPRSSRFLRASTGDSISNYGLGLLADFPVNKYKGALSPMYKFLDITEVIHSLMISYVAAVTAYLEKSNIIEPDVFTMLTNGLGCTYTQFLIMLRQQILWWFADSQCLAQGLCPQTGSGAFQAFLCGSNCYPKNPSVLMKIPMSLNENLRQLVMCAYQYQTKNYQSSNNEVRYIPVWGAFKGSVPIQYNIVWNSINYPVFEVPTEDPYTPDIFDGTSGSSVVDFNESALLSNITASWNEVVTYVTDQYASLVTIGGDARGGALLQYTRLVQFATLEKDVTMFKRIPRHYDQFITIKDVEVPNLERKNSKKEFKKVKTYNPPGSTIYAEYTLGITSRLPISPTFKEYTPDLILPVIEIASDESIPSINQVQTSYQEPYSSKPGVNVIVFDNRAQEIYDGLPNMVTKTAGKKTELSMYFDELSRLNEGGFLSQLFTLGGPLIGAIDPGIGSAVSSVGNVLGAFDL